MDNPILLTIAICEIGFWVLVIGGLCLRYLARMRRASTITLALLPVLDLVLIGAVALDLHRGGDVEFAHRLAGIYLGWTVVFSHSTVAWLDVRFAHQFAGGPAPVKAPKTGPQAYRKEIRGFVKWLVAATIALVITYGLAYTVADSEQAAALKTVIQPLGVITFFWFVTGPLWVAGKHNSSSKDAAGERSRL
ncbi:hypothetical protein [Rhodococcus cercidiphylli]|jgi:hypothetical protein|uniref:Uncharacterized protein n=1 Tax=Rhodococcus cercidiphylli TaxID=489916 RepID=A0ABU4AYD9_9NOCA|nr:MULTISPECIES: hypothetical protein [Rhodococcus]MDI6629411.1 hypothetical protein [Rhodococcus sp. (in: high G+C Gram-positive bacteria)]MDV6231260.1 hypothetical protein [Rhodococcus cercidiphylli]